MRNEKSELFNPSVLRDKPEQTNPSYMKDMISGEEFNSDQAVAEGPQDAEVLSSDEALPEQQVKVGAGIAANLVVTDSWGNQEPLAPIPVERDTVRIADEDVTWQMRANAFGSPERQGAVYPPAPRGEIIVPER